MSKYTWNPVLEPGTHQFVLNHSEHPHSNRRLQILKPLPENDFKTWRCLLDELIAWWLSIREIHATDARSRFLELVRLEAQIEDRAFIDLLLEFWILGRHHPEMRSHPLLADVLAQHPIETVNGLPVLDEHLRWSGCELFLMGPWAALHVGPVAGNLFGGKLVCDRIVPALTKTSLSFAQG